MVCADIGPIKNTLEDFLFHPPDEREKNSNCDVIGSFENMNQFYRNRDWFCHGCSMSIFPFLSLADDDFLIACNELNYPHRTNINIENVKNMYKEANTFTEAHKTHEKCCDFDKMYVCGGIG